MNFFSNYKNEHLKKLFLLIALVVLFSFFASAQVSFFHLSSIPLGEINGINILEKERITASIGAKPKYMKGNFMNSYIIKYYNLNIDELGQSFCEMLFLKNRLMKIRLSFEFRPPDTSKLFNFYKLLKSELLSDTFKFKSPSNSINIPQIKNHVNKYFYPLKSQIDTVPIDAIKGFGCEYYQKLNYTENTIRVCAQLESENIISYLNNYSGPVFKWSLEIYPEKAVNLLNISDDALISYTEILETEQFLPLTIENGVFFIDAKINDGINLKFLLDLGASDVHITSDVYSILKRNGTLTESDELGYSRYTIANGDTVKSRIVNLKSIKLGSRVINNVRASISENINAPLLLGQSALKKLGVYKIDNQKALLIIE